MDRTYWRKQESEQPLFPDLLWSRPENKQLAGKLCIIGGNLHGFRAPAEAFVESVRAGIGVTRVLLPDAIKKHVGGLIETVEYATSTPSGSFAQTSLAEWLDVSAWADGTLLAGNFGSNSETSIVFEKFLQKHTAHLTLVDDSISYATDMAKFVLNRDQTTLVVTLAQLQKFTMNAGSTTAVTSTMDYLHIVDALHELSHNYTANVMLYHVETVFVAVRGQVTSTKVPAFNNIKTAAHAAVWLLQNPTKPIQALTTSLK